MQLFSKELPCPGGTKLLLNFDAVRCVWYICNSNAFSFLLNLYETDVLLSCLAWAQTEREEEMQNHVSIGLIKLRGKSFTPLFVLDSR